MRGSIPFIILLCIAATSCTTAQHHQFSVQPDGRVEPLAKTEPQKGRQSLPAITRPAFLELTIAQGSGMDGFDSIRVFADGSGYAVVGTSGSQGVRVPLRLTGSQLDRLITATREDHLNRIGGLYTTHLVDGTQGFVEVVTSAGRVYSWLDNYFEPVTHIYRFCNAEIWPDVHRRLPQYAMHKRRVLQEEYHRIFRD